ncbi:FG-GAP-like repeat-containing protein [Rubrivirga sp.]|uniref:FG-GAP-like repeat-containing protein n=1 Tax=Rubrivirga sp. TaxID=1885344 RepID=UPI003B526A90
MALTATLPPSSTLDKRLVLAALLLAAVAVAFWTGSRYPALDDKALMGGDARIEGLAFDQIVAVDADAPVALRVGANALNWAYTNKQGMTFGVLFAALMLTVLPLLSRRQFEGRMANTLLGVAMGAPLGVCVNCAVPVAEGLHKGGARAETTVATLLSSPTLNAVVLSMTFALFPLWLAGLKVGLTLLFIVSAVPLLVRALWRGEGAAPRAEELDLVGPDLPAAPALDDALGPDVAPATWGGAAGWTVRAVARNLWYLVRTTVPLMLLAGLLGAIAVTVLPWETLVDLLPEISFRSAPVGSLAALGAVALIGVFLPVPIAFDVIICAILAATGVPMAYVATLFVTLGLFSVYPALQMWRTMSAATAVGLFLSVAALGLGAGVVADYTDERYREWARDKTQAILLMADATAERPTFPTEARTAGDVRALLVGRAVRPSTPVRGAWPAGVSVERSPFAGRPSGTPAMAFTRVPGSELGLVDVDNFTPIRMVAAAANRSSASGDVNGDGWPDLVFTSEAGVSLWANVGGERFVRQEIAVPALDAAAIRMAALADLDGDGAPDLVVGTYDAGEHVVYNDGGAFTAAAHVRLPRPEGAALTSTFAFGDVDLDGDLDVVVGRAVGYNVALARGGDEEVVSPPGARNTLLVNGGGRGAFAMRSLPGPDGETLTTLLSDLDLDGDLDLTVGNDFSVPDVFYDGDGAGGFRIVTNQEGRIPASTTTTMAMVSADLDNDLDPELFVAQISRGRPHRASVQKVCGDLPGADRETCVRRMTQQRTMVAARGRNEPSLCLSLPTAQDQADCAARIEFHVEGIGHSGPPPSCERLAANPRWAGLAERCRLGGAPLVRPSPEERATFIPSRMEHNVLFRRTDSGAYEEVAEPMGLSKTAWTWNARFADLDQDGWQDLYVVSGHMINRQTDRNLLFRNVGGERFEDVTEAAGVASWLDTFSYTYVDYDRDGDLDLVVPSGLGPVEVYRNDTGGAALQIALHDGASANPSGVGAVVTITTADGQRQMREVTLSGGYLSWDEPVAHFGLGTATGVQRVEVRWPTGERTRLDGPLAAGARYVVRRAAAGAPRRP